MHDEQETEQALAATRDPQVMVELPAERGYPAERYSPPMVKLDPHRFTTTEYDAIPVEKMELWDGVLYGPTYLQESMLVALLSNVGLRRVVELIPRERWLAALGLE